MIRGPTESEPSLGSVLPWTVGPNMAAAFTSFVPGVNIPSKCHSLLPKLWWLHSIHKPKPNPCPHASGPSECTFPLLQGGSRPPEVSLVPGLPLRTLFPVLRDACTSPCLKPIQFKFTIQGPSSRALCSLVLSQDSLIFVSQALHGFSLPPLSPSALPKVLLFCTVPLGTA